MGLSLSILYHPTAVERNGHCVDSGPCGALRARERAVRGRKGERREAVWAEGRTALTDFAIWPANDWGVGRAAGH